MTAIQRNAGTQRMLVLSTISLRHLKLLAVVLVVVSWLRRNVLFRLYRHRDS